MATPTNPHDDFVIEDRQLSCGVRLLVESNPSVKSAAISWWVPTGTMDDPDGENADGLAVLCAGMLERGAGGLDSRQFNDGLDRLGVIRSISVHDTSTRFSASLRTEELPRALEMLSDMILDPLMPEDGLNPVRSLCLQSIQGLVDQPPELASIRLNHLALPSPYNRSAYGSQQVLESATIEEIREAWRTRCLPHGSIISLAGGVDIDSVMEILENRLSGWSGTSIDAPTPRLRIGGDEHVEQSGSQVHVEMAFDAPSLGSSEELSFLVATRILGGGSSSRLFDHVREQQGLCYDVHAGYLRRNSGSLCMIGAGTTPDRVSRTIESIYEELERFGTGGITQDEFDNVMVGLKTRLMMHGESMSARAGAIAADFHDRGAPRTLSEVAQEIDELSYKVVDGLVRSYFTADWASGVARVAVGPSTPFAS
jgi:predicted Zn-dependent peptidase